MSKSLRAVLLSLVTVCICLALLIGGTYALFSDNVQVNSHLSAGKLKVSLSRVEYKECVLTSDGTLAESQPDNTRVDLTSTTSDDLTLFNVEKSVPGCWYEVTLELGNGGDVAFDYGIKMLWDAENASAEEAAIAAQLEISVAEGTENLATFRLSEAAAAGDEGDGNLSLGYMAAGEGVKTLVIRATFVDDDDNNAAQEGNIEFDLQIFAAQRTANG